MAKWPRVALVGLILLGLVGAFAFFGGWLSPRSLTPAAMTDAFERVDGVHPGFRRNHAKGVCVTGTFVSNGNAAGLSKAEIFRAGSYPVVGRFSVGGGQPYAMDDAFNVRGLGLRFSLPHGEEWRMAMINLFVFPVNTPQAFYERLLASVPDAATGKADPAKLKAFMEAHPESQAAIGLIKAHPPSSGFYNSTFNSLNAFVFVNEAGQERAVRWQFVPTEPFAPVPAATAAASEPASQADPDKHPLFTALIAKIHEHPVEWHLVLTVAQAGDPTDDATIPWPENRERIDAGTLRLDRVEAEESSVARDLNFDPLVLPVGMRPSGDPLLSARSAVYSQSFTRRSGEAKAPSALSPADVEKGGHP